MKKIKAILKGMGGCLYALIVLMLLIVGLYCMFKSLTNFLAGVIIILSRYVYVLWRLINDFAYKNLSYRLSILIEPKWSKILPEKFPNTFKNEMDYYEFFKKNKDTVIPQDFSFTVYHDGISGLEQVWSNTYKTFLKDLLIIDRVDNENWMNLFKENENWGGYIQISPNGISIKDKSQLPEYGSWSIDLEFIPFYEIQNFLKTIYLKENNNYDLKHSVEFSNEIQQKLEKNNISYEYDFGNHIFKNDYFYISFDIEFFENYKKKENYAYN